MGSQNGIEDRYLTSEGVHVVQRAHDWSAKRSGKAWRARLPEIVRERKRERERKKIKV